jgi:hypothetical protein
MLLSLCWQLSIPLQHTLCAWPGHTIILLPRSFCLLARLLRDCVQLVCVLLILITTINATPLGWPT